MRQPPNRPTPPPPQPTCPAQTAHTQILTVLSVSSLLTEKTAYKQRGDVVRTESTLESNRFTLGCDSCCVHVSMGFTLNMALTSQPPMRGWWVL